MKNNPFLSFYCYFHFKFDLLLDMQKRFYSKVDGLTNMLLAILMLLPIPFLILDVYVKEDLLVLHIILIGMALVLLWMRFATYYTIMDGVLKYQSGPIRGKIQIENIQKIVLNSRDSYNSGNLSNDKMKIVNPKEGSLNISPLHKQQFANALLAINPKIKIIES